MCATIPIIPGKASKDRDIVKKRRRREKKSSYFGNNYVKICEMKDKGKTEDRKPLGHQHTRKKLLLQEILFPVNLAIVPTFYNNSEESSPPSSPERTVHMAAKALILRAFISLLAQRQITSTHISRKPMARRPMYVNSLMTDSQRTPGSINDRRMNFV